MSVLNGAANMSHPLVRDSMWRFRPHRFHSLCFVNSVVVPSRSGLSQTRCQDRQFADLLPLDGTPELGMIHHPHLGNDFANQLSMTEKSHQRTLGNHNTHCPGDSTHVGGGNVTAAESQRHVHLCGHSIEIAASGKENSFAAYHEPAIQLRQFFDSSPEIEIGDVE